MKGLEIEDVKIEWLGHASFRVTGKDVIIYLDPYILDDDPPKADIVLVSHDHFDHKDDENIRKISKEDTVVVGPESVTKGYENSVTVKPGDEVEVKGVRIKVVPAYNPEKPFHPKEKGYVGFVFQVGSVKIYHPGDTEFIPEMESLAGENIDVALLPIGGTYVMDEEQAARAANLIRPKYVVPMHYGKWRDIDLPGDVNRLRSMLDQDIRLVELEPVGKG